ncbi:TonB family protein [Duganella sp. P38]|uniref:TonB family protein n=1 Tax=Duganella sp. P38 TaxID=3423949 RepID=UPI003D7ABDE1
MLILLPLFAFITADAAEVRTAALVNFNTCAKPEWPKEALREEESGTVHMKFLIDEEGKVLDSLVQTSSGSSLLDDAAINGIRSCAFTPATLNGVAVRGWQKMQYVWSLETDELVRKTKEEAVKYRAAAIEGDAAALYQLAQLFRNRIVFPFDNEKYMQLLRMSADRSHPEAEYELGANYNSGVILGKDPSQALAWYQRAADHGHPSAQYRLGDYYESGTSVRQDLAQAASWYRLAAEQGEPAAELAMGRLHETGQVVERSAEQAGVWYRKAADAGNTEAAYRLARLYLQANDTSHAVLWFTVAAKDRVGQAEAALANLYFTGAGVPQSDEQGLKYLYRAANAGDAPAMRQLGLMLSQGLRTAADTQQGKLWLDKAERLGSPAQPGDIVRFQP